LSKGSESYDGTTSFGNSVPAADLESSGAAVISAGGVLSKPAYFLHWGVVQISLANFLVIVAMIVIFVLALVIPFPSRDDSASQEDLDGSR
jgi:hypothetical protein